MNLLIGKPRIFTEELAAILLVVFVPWMVRPF